MAFKKLPEFADATEKIHFGDVGYYIVDTTDFVLGTHDGLITNKDLEFIDDYYRRISTGESITPEETEYMNAAGFNKECKFDEATYIDSEGNERVYESWLAIEYNTPDYRAFINAFIKRLDISAIGDITLDGVCNNSDVEAIEDILVKTKNSSGGYSKDLQINFLSTHIFNPANGKYSEDAIPQTTTTIIQANQSFVNGHVMDTQDHLSSNDAALIKTMASNDFGVTKQLADTAVFENEEVELLLVSEHKDVNTFTCKWSYNDGSQIVTIEPPNPDYEIAEKADESGKFKLKIKSSTREMNNRTYRITLYRTVKQTIIEDGKETEKEKEISHTYTCKLYVNTPTLIGDVTNDGVVNIIDAYKVFNKFIYSMGDIDMDSSISGTDASLALLWYAIASTSTSGDKQAILEAFQESLTETTQLYNLDDIDRGDMNLDNAVDAIDASKILNVYVQLSTGKTLSEIEAEIQEKVQDFKFYTTEVLPTTEGELAALLLVDGQRQSKYTKYSGEQILESVKNNTIHLS